MIEIKNIKIMFYEAGIMMMWFTSPSCTFDRARMTAVSTSTVYVARSDVVITGEGFEWSSKDGQFMIHNQVKVLVRNSEEVSK